MDNGLRAENLQKILTNMVGVWLGGRQVVTPPERREEIFRNALDEAGQEGGVTLCRVYRGVPATVGRADVLAVRFGDGVAAQWVALVMLEKGHTQVVRPFTEETARMDWLETFLREQAGGA